MTIKGKEGKINKNKEMKRKEERTNGIAQRNRKGLLGSAADWKPTRNILEWKCQGEQKLQSKNVEAAKNFKAM